MKEKYIPIEVVRSLIEDKLDDRKFVFDINIRDIIDVKTNEPKSVEIDDEK